MPTIQTHSSLPWAAAAIRQAVFVQEQGFVEEFDAQDAAATHLVLVADNGRPMATCRYFQAADGAWVIGRVAVLPEFRGAHGGAALLREAERQIAARGGRKIRLAAQVRARGFYEKAGYTAYGEEFPEEYCPHIWMKKQARA